MGAPVDAHDVVVPTHVGAQEELYCSKVGDMKYT
jgi:hypothetical protein